MQQHDSNVLIHAKKYKLNRSEKEEVVPKYKFALPPYYREDHENVEFEQITQNFEPPIHYMVEQEAIT
jgi:hypothetical protein